MSTATKPRILVIEDEPDLAELLASELALEGYDPAVCHDGLRGLSEARRQPPDLVVLDRMLPGLDGIEVCRRIRAGSDVPILMLTALDQVGQRVEGFNAGATDYLSKPFSLAELLARVKAQLQLRRPPTRTRYLIADLVVDLEAREVRRADQPVIVTQREFDLLAYHIRHPRQVKSRGQILDAVWGHDFVGDENTLEVTMSHLRIKLERDGALRLIHTVRGVGYVLREPS